MITPGPGPQSATVPNARRHHSSISEKSSGSSPEAAADGAAAVPPVEGAPTRRAGGKSTPTSGARDVCREAHRRDLRALRLHELRAMRRSAQCEEASLSFVRRLLQGRIDILEAELRRRAAQDSALLERLPQILADTPTPQRSSARHVTLALPDGAEYQRLVEQTLAEVALSDLTARTDAELHDALRHLATCEARVSRQRQSLHQTADACSAEIARRYREGEARVDDLLS